MGGGPMDPATMADMEANLDKILAQASEGMPPELVEDIKTKAPQRWASDGPSAAAQKAALLSESTASTAPQAQLRVGRRTSEAPKVQPELSTEEQAEKKKEEGNSEFKKKRYAAAIN